MAGIFEVPLTVAGCTHVTCFLTCNKSPVTMTSNSGMQVITAPQRCSFLDHQFHEAAMRIQVTFGILTRNTRNTTSLTSSNLLAATGRQLLTISF